MKPIEFYDRLQTITESSTLSLAPGPLVIKVGVADAMAAKLLLWLYDEMPEGATVGDMFDVLDAAHWWATFWSSLVDSEEVSEEQAAAGGERGNRSVKGEK